MEEEALTCESCGTMLKRKPQKDEGIAAIRQGKPSSRPLVIQGRGEEQRPREGKIYGAREIDGVIDTRNKEEESDVVRRRRSDVNQQKYRADAGRPQSKRGIAPIPTETRNMASRMESKNKYLKKAQKRAVNWMKLGIVLIAFMLFLGLGALVYLKRIPSGQRLNIKLGGEGPAEAYWLVAEENMKEGKVNLAIENFLIADEKQRASADKKDKDNITGLLNLASAYEVAGEVEKGEEIYRYLMTQVEAASNKKEPYENLIRILMSSDRETEAATIMQTAYEKTGEEKFLRQRSQTLPAMPEIETKDGKTLVSGVYSEYIHIPLTSPQGYEVYYTIEEGRLPTAKDPVTEGELYTQPIYLNSNNVFVIRAIARDGELTSDPLVLSYTISLPLPPAPDANLAPNTYKSKQTVSLRHENMDKVTIYYTIDGSKPDTDSPVYTAGDKIQLPNGRVFLRAVAIDEMGVVSNTREVEYVINAGKVVKKYSVEDTFKNFTINKTLQDEFEKMMNGTPDKSEIEEGKTKLTYPWGYAISENAEGRKVISEVYMTEEVLEPPRHAKIGMTIEGVTALFRDLGQVANGKGNRGIYSDSDGIATLTQLEGNKQLLEYKVLTPEGRYWVLQFHGENNKIVAILHKIE